jgi:hypothetical protein
MLLPKRVSSSPSQNLFWVGVAISVVENRKKFAFRSKGIRLQILIHNINIILAFQLLEGLMN